MLTVATCLWDRNESTFANSASYNESWVEKLYRNFRQHLTVPHRFICFVDEPRPFHEMIYQIELSTRKPTYSSFTEPYQLGEPMILVGLDTVVCRNVDHLGEWCLTGDRVALNRDVANPSKPINGVALVPKGWRRIYEEWRGENDMDWLANFPWEPIDDRWPDQVVSYKLRVRPNGDRLSSENRIVYMHGQPKQDTLGHLPWVADNWR